MYWVTWYNGIGNGMYYKTKEEAFYKVNSILEEDPNAIVLLTHNGETVWTNRQIVIPTSELPF